MSFTRRSCVGLCNRNTGVHALTKIPPSQVILYVPLHLIMTSEVAKESSIGVKIIKAGTVTQWPLLP